MGLMALLFVAAQLLFAIHSDDLTAHTPQSCEYCLAAAISDDPKDLEVEIVAPAASIEAVKQAIAQKIIVSRPLDAAVPRGPPFL